MSDWPTVDEFSKDMKRKLDANKHKGGWSGSHCSVDELYTMLYAEFEELEKSLEEEGYEEMAIDECADIANFAMMIADRMRAIVNKTNTEGG